MTTPQRRSAWLAASSVVLTLLATIACGQSDDIETGGDSVVLLHGLGRSAAAMKPLANHLRAAGFTVHNLDYPSTDHTPDELVAWLDDALLKCCERTQGALHFVTHSLGGILVRAQLEVKRPARLGRVVQIAPPNHGSEIVDSLVGNPLFEVVLGPTGSDLGTGPDSFPNRIGAPDYEIGIIAGSASINPVGAVLLPEENDGTVSVASARLEGATDFIVVEANHTFIMQEPEVAEQVIHFIREGRFDHDPASVSPGE
jgi:pimeloyl-ACP methyl ester carboxylesterase